MKSFNTAGLCIPTRHFMVDISDKIAQIAELVYGGKYFTINKARQYGKTTTLAMLEKYLGKRYYVLRISFEGVGDSYFSSEENFVQRFAKTLDKRMKYVPCLKKIKEIWQRYSKELFYMDDLSECISEFCLECDMPIVLMIDEVDKSSDNQIFLSFLGMLRNKYLEREEAPTFQSVILAGVYDIKNLKLKLRSDEEKKYNSPWNVAVRFDVDMSLSAEGISGMLEEYQKEHYKKNTGGINISALAEKIYEYTSGYPYLVSAICQIMDEVLPKREKYHEASSVWTQEGIADAVKIILNERSPLFDDMRKKLDENKELRKIIYEMLFRGEEILYNPDYPAIEIGVMFGFLKVNGEQAAVANRIFEMRLYNLFLAEATIGNQIYKEGQLNKERFIKNGQLDMEIVLEKFVEYFTDIYADCEQKFVEENGRRFFLLYLKAIINGEGNYYIEARTRNLCRTDVIIDYRGKQYIVELKIWRGQEYNQRGEKQLSEYLRYYGLEKGYMLSFCFNKKKKIGIHEVYCEDKVIIEAVV